MLVRKKKTAKKQGCGLKNSVLAGAKFTFEPLTLWAWRLVHPLQVNSTFKHMLVEEALLCGFLLGGCERFSKALPTAQKALATAQWAGAK